MELILNQFVKKHHQQEDSQSLNLVLSGLSKGRWILGWVKSHDILLVKRLFVAHDQWPSSFMVQPKV